MRRFALAALVMLAACTPREQAFSPPAEPPQIAADVFKPGDGAELPLKSWLPKGRVRAVVVALHGFNDYSNAFADVAGYFATRGIATYAYDQRGFGGAPERGIWAGEANFVSDAKQMVAAVRARHPKAPVYLLGESMGGAVAIATLASAEPPKVDGAILSAPAVWGGEEMNPFYRATLWALVHVWPAKELTGEGLRIMASDNIEMLRALSRDPLVLKGSRADAAYGLVNLMDTAHARAPGLELPVLLLYGAHDEIIPEPPVRKLAETLKDNQRFIYYPEGYHMLMRDLQRKRVWKDMAEWILARGTVIAHKKKPTP